MLTRTVCLLLCLLTGPAFAAASSQPGVSEAVAAHPAQGIDAEAREVRAGGPERAAAEFALYAEVIDAYRDARANGDAERVAELESTIRYLDQVAQQRDAYAARLFWFTDLAEATAYAQETGKPILSLRMLGNLDEEYSCANSRFFRTVLYADESLGKMLRDEFVLHWQSVRPVPVITIDMGDGRTIKRTITGNSAHYVLDTRGRVVDALPGLYGARTFERKLAQAREFAESLADADDKTRAAAMQAWHNDRATELSDRWASIVAGGPTATSGAGPQAVIDWRLDLVTFSTPSALEAAPMAVTKSGVEAPLVEVALPAGGRDVDEAAAIRTTVSVPDRGTLILGGKGRAEQPMLAAIEPNAPVTVVDPHAATDEQWVEIAAAYARESRLDDASRQLLSEKAMTDDRAAAAARRATTKSFVEDPMLRVVRNFEQSVALDTARNEHLFHAQIHGWLAQQPEAYADPDVLNKRVYAELFLTPDEDPWLGLVPADTYTALDGEGLID